MIDLRAHLAPTRKELERFGILFFAVMSVIGGLLYWRGSHSWPAFALAAAVFLAMRLTMPLALRPVYVVWMTFGSILAWVNTRVLLGVLFYLVMTPIGLVMRALGKESLGVRFDPKAKSYWINRAGPVRGRERYEQMF